MAKLKLKYESLTSAAKTLEKSVIIFERIKNSKGKKSTSK